MITALHSKAQGACGRVAFYYDEVDAPEDVIEAERVEMPDGSKQEPGDIMICGSCGMEIGPSCLDLIPGKWDAKTI